MDRPAENTITSHRHNRQQTTGRGQRTQTMPATIPAFLVPRGAPSARSLHLHRLHAPGRQIPHRCPFTTSTTLANESNSNNNNPRVLEKPDKFRPPSHAARRVVQTRNGRVVGGGSGANPVNYPGPKLSDQEREEKRTKQYPNMFPPEGTVMFRFLTSRWIHVWIAMVSLFSRGMAMRWDAPGWKNRAD